MRYLPHTTEEIQQMLATIGVRQIDDLFANIPKELRFQNSLSLSAPLSEVPLRNHLRNLSRKNAHGEEWGMFLGGGSYSHYIPSAVPYLLSRGEFLTAYTPYQPEISQGTLQAIYEYQTMMAEILGMEIANASQYDGSTGTAEAIRLALAITKRKKILIARSLHPEYREVIRTYLQNEILEVVEIPFTPQGGLDFDFVSKQLSEEVACIVVGYPNFFGIVENFSELEKSIHQVGALFITVTTDPLSLGLFKSPGEIGADIAVAEGQSFGIAMSFGGPGLGMFATKRDYVRQMPGRLVGETVDAEGQRGYVLTLSTREQHIRREKATSNICTNVSLCALAAAMTLALWGRAGFRELSQINYDLCEELKNRLSSFSRLELPFSGATFNEFVLKAKTKTQPAEIVEKLLKEKLIAGIPIGRWYPELSDALLLCVTEMNTEDQIQKLTNALGGIV